jgi:hypothetical protein
MVEDMSKINLFTECLPDVNVLLNPDVDLSYIIKYLLESHGYAHEWYRSSVSKFKNKDILQDKKVPDTDPPWGFYWWDKNNRYNIVEGINTFYQVYFEPQYQLSLLNYLLQPVGAVYDGAVYAGKLSFKTVVIISNYADSAATKVNMMIVNTFNAVDNTINYTVDAAEKAYQAFTDWVDIPVASGLAQQYSTADEKNGILMIEMHSDSPSVVTTTLDVPSDANALTFGYEFIYADTETVFEVAINGTSVYHIASSDTAGQGYQLIPWINIAKYAGNTIQFTLRLSNPVDGTNASVSIDDLIIARIEKAEHPILSVSPTSQSVQKEAGSTTFNVVNADTGILFWTVEVISGSEWLSIESGTSGANSGAITCSFTENNSISARTGTIRVSATGASDSPKDITITQEGIPVQTILTVNPTNQNVSENAGNTSFTVSNSGNGNMSWTAEVVSGNDFMTITSGDNGVDSGTISCSIAANPVFSARTATIRITASGATGSPAEVTVTQDAATKPILSVSPDNQNVEYTAGTAGFTVSNTGTGTMNWESQVTSGSEWFEIQNGISGTNSGAIQCAFSINPDPTERIGTIRVSATNATDSPKDITVTQAAAPKPVISVAPSNQSVSKDAGTTTFAVSNTGTGTMSWTASVTSDGNWLSITSGDKGTNSGTIACAFTTNTNKTDRIGIIQVTAPDATGSPKVVTVTQEKGNPDPVISGLIETESGKAISGVTITFSNDVGTATSDSTGNYNKTVDLGWSGTTTPTKSGYKFNPPFKEYSTVIIDQTEQDFIGQALPADQLLGAWQNGVWAWEKDSNKWTKLSSKTANASMIATGDVDGDKVDDLIGVWQSGLYVLQSTDGQWVKLSKTNPTWIAAGDLNNDGKADVIGSWPGDGTYFRDSSNGKWTKLSKPAKQIASGNIGGSRDDLVAVLSDGLWVRYSADASWLKLDSMIPSWTTAGDMNGDNRADIVVSKTDGTWYRNSDTGAWTKISTPAEQLAVGDIDGDGRDDLVGIWSNKLLIRYGANGQWQQLSTSKPKWITTGRVSEAMKASDAVEQQVAEKYIDLSAEGPGGKAFQSVIDHASGMVMTE